MKTSGIHLPKSNSREISKFIGSRKLEDPLTLKMIEDFLSKKRGYVFRMPRPDTSAISFFSGGLDTTVVTAILMQEYGLKVHPLYFKRGIKNSAKARESLNFLRDFFTEKYPENFYHPVSLTLSVPAPEISEILTLTHASSQEAVPGTNQQRGIPFQPSLYAYHALLYCQYYKAVEGVGIRSIFGAWLPVNGDSYAYETLTAIRTIMFELCTLTRDPSWQFTSLPIEKELGFFFGKETLIRWGAENGIPLEKTWSCSQGFRLHCGECGNCLERRASFIRAKIEDRTKYLKYIPLKLMKS